MESINRKTQFQNTLNQFLSKRNITINNKFYNIEGIFPIFILITIYFAVYILNYLNFIPYLQVQTIMGSDIPNPLTLFTSIFFYQKFYYLLIECLFLLMGYPFFNMYSIKKGILIYLSIGIVGTLLSSVIIIILNMYLHSKGFQHLIIISGSGSSVCSIGVATISTYILMRNRKANIAKLKEILDYSQIKIIILYYFFIFVYIYTIFFTDLTDISLFSGLILAPLLSVGINEGLLIKSLEWGTFELNGLIKTLTFTSELIGTQYLNHLMGTLLGLFYIIGLRIKKNNEFSKIGLLKRSL